MVSLADIFANIAALLGIKAVTTSSSVAAKASTSSVASLTTYYMPSVVYTTYVTTSIKCQNTVGAICVNPTRLTITTSSIKSTTTVAYATQSIGLPAPAVPSLVTLYTTSTSWSTYHSNSYACKYTMFNMCINPYNLVVTLSSAVPQTYPYTTQTITPATTKAATTAPLTTSSAAPVPVVTSASSTSSKLPSTTSASSTVASSSSKSSVASSSIVPAPSSSKSTLASAVPSTSSASSTAVSSFSSLRSPISVTPSASSVPSSTALPSSSSIALPSSSSIAVPSPSPSSSLAAILSSADFSASLAYYPGEEPSSSPTAFVQAPSSSSATSTSVNINIQPSSSAVLLSSSVVPSSSAIASSTTASAASSPSCTGTSQVETDSAGNTWTIYCASDSNLPSYAAALFIDLSYEDCITACNLDAVNNCAGFTYVGGDKGVGPGICWLRTEGGTLLTGPSNYVVGLRNTPAAAASSTGLSIPTLSIPSLSIPSLTIPTLSIPSLSLPSLAIPSLSSSSLSTDTPSTTAPSTTGFLTLTGSSSSTLDSSSSTPSSSAPSSSTTPAAAVTQPTCGLNAWAATGDIGYYTDVTLTNYAGCLALCQTTAGCLSFALSTGSPVCILYAASAVGHTVADPGSLYIFYEGDGSCPVIASSTTSSAPVSTATGAYPFCPAGIVPFIYGTYTGTYTPCDSNPYSTCAQDVDGSAYCNTCGSCIGAVSCTADSDCTTKLGAGYACITGSACPPTVNGHPNGVAGAPVCLYMLAGGADKGCYGADSN